MTGATLVLCIWPEAPTLVDVALVWMVWTGLMEPEPAPPQCVLNVIPVVSCADLAPALRLVREQYPAAMGGCRP